jgi:hypothetical protein
MFAQLCSGNPSFDGAPIHAAANVGLDKSTVRYTGELRIRVAGVFAALDGGLKTWNVTSLNGQGNEWGITAGLQLPRARDSRYEICPLVNWNSTAGPKNVNGTPWRYAEKSLSGRLSAGYRLKRTKVWDFLPTTTLTFGRADTKMTTTTGGNLATYRSVCCGRRSFTMLGFGLGLLFSNEVVLIPWVDLPLNSNRETTYGVRAAIRFKGI